MGGTRKNGDRRGCLDRGCVGRIGRRRTVWWHWLGWLEVEGDTGWDGWRWGGRRTTVAGVAIPGGKLARAGRNVHGEMPIIGWPGFFRPPVLSHSTDVARRAPRVGPLLPLHHPSAGTQQAYVLPPTYTYPSVQCVRVCACVNLHVSRRWDGDGDEPARAPACVEYIFILTRRSVEKRESGGNCYKTYPVNCARAETRSSWNP